MVAEGSKLQRQGQNLRGSNPCEALLLIPSLQKLQIYFLSTFTVVLVKFVFLCADLSDLLQISVLTATRAIRRLH